MGTSSCCKDRGKPVDIQQRVYIYVYIEPEGIYIVKARRVSVHSEDAGEAQEA
jgi:hypothetical protein